MCTCLLAECECVYVCVSDVEVYEKLSCLKNSKCTNFDMAMNVFSLAVYSPIFRWRYVCDYRTCEGEKAKEEVVFESVEYTGYLFTWSAPNARLIFAQDKFLWDSKRADVVKDTGTWLLRLSRFPKLLILLWRLTIFVSGTGEFWIIFSRICPLHVLFADWSKNIEV